MICKFPNIFEWRSRWCSLGCSKIAGDSAFERRASELPQFKPSVNSARAKHPVIVSVRKPFITPGVSIVLLSLLTLDAKLRYCLFGNFNREAWREITKCLVRFPGNLPRLLLHFRFTCFLKLTGGSLERLPPALQGTSRDTNSHGL